MVDGVTEGSAPELGTAQVVVRVLTVVLECAAMTAGGFGAVMVFIPPLSLAGQYLLVFATATVALRWGWWLLVGRRLTNGLPPYDWVKEPRQ